MDLGTLTAGILTIAVFTFLYKDNLLYRFAEHLLIGLSVGFIVVLAWNTTLKSLLFIPLFSNNDYWQIIPLLLSLTMILRLKKNWTKFSKPTLALLIGSGAGVSIPAMLEARILRQLAATVDSFVQINSGELSSAVSIITVFISLIGLICTMVYFFYTRPDTKLVRGISTIGTYFLMIFFGATFGYTVTSRLTLLVGRLEFLLGDFFGIL